MDIPFSKLMEQATALKTNQDAVDRKLYDSWAPWYQHSIFSKEDVIEIRELDFTKQYKFSIDCKMVGNEYFKESKYYEAINEYERALSIFSWIVPIDPNWKKQSITDAKIKQYKYETTIESEKELISKHELACLLNIANTYQALNEWKKCILACDAALIICPTSAKALYRRAQARILPMSSGMVENEIALKDLKLAYEILPTDQVISKAYKDLKKLLHEQNKNDKKKIRELFDSKQQSCYADSNDKNLKGINHSYENNNIKEESVGNHIDSSSFTLKDALEKVLDMESAANQMKLDGRHIDAKNTYMKANSIKKLLENHMNETKIKHSQDILTRKEDFEKIDFLNPTEEMTKEALKNGLDLEDNKVKKMMAALHKESLAEKDDSIDKNILMERALNKILIEDSNKISQEMLEGLSEISLKEIIKKRKSYKMKDESYEQCNKIRNIFHTEDIDDNSKSDYKIAYELLRVDVYEVLSKESENEQDSLLNVLVDRYGKTLQGVDSKSRSWTTIIFGVLFGLIAIFFQYRYFLPYFINHSQLSSIGNRYENEFD